MVSGERTVKPSPAVVPYRFRTVATRKPRVVVRTPAVMARRRRRTALGLVFAQLIVSALVLLRLPLDDRVIAAPMLAIALMATVYMFTLWARDGYPPVFEAGTLCVLAITVYGTLPLLGFVMMDGEWDSFADGRLQQYPFIPAELGLFGWRYVVYAASFVGVYLVIRGRATARAPLTPPKQTTQTALIIVFLALTAGKIALRLAYGYDLGDFDYTDVEGSMARGAAVVQRMPYFVLQIAHNLLSALFVVELGLMILLFANWRRRWCRWAVGLWLAYEIFHTVSTLGSRGRVVLLLISAGVLYHRLVKPVRFRGLITAGSLLLAGFLVAGAVRMAKSPHGMKARAAHVLTGGNEFQALFTTAFDIEKRQELNLIPSVPWQLYVSDFYYVIPSQLLPFEKIDPSLWYLDVVGLKHAGVGFMFGVMSQAAVGLDWIELVIRGTALATVLALLQRWTVRRPDFWPTFLSLFISIWVYYTFRASTFYFLYFIVYHFLPVFAATALLERVLARMVRRRQPARAAAT